MKIIQPSDKRELPKAGELYRHFKGQVYCVCGFVINATNGADSSQMVLYIPESQIFSSYKNFYCRSIKEFLSPVDREKYPDAKQQWRFEKVNES